MVGKDKNMLGSAQHEEYLPQGDAFARLCSCLSYFLTTNNKNTIVM